MRILVAPDSFKECLTSREVTRIILEEIRSLHPEWTVQGIPLSDGGEGFAEILSEALGAERVPVSVTGPMGEKVNTFYRKVGDTAIMDVASACGLQLVPPSRRNPLKATSMGVGEMMISACDAGCRKIILGLGGSATCDGGEGITALPRFKELAGRVELELLCDVENPFLGIEGAARVFGPQKGADPEMVEILEKRMRERAAAIFTETSKDISFVPGAGAAGGIAGALYAYLGGKILSGADAFFQKVGFFEALKGVDLVITGEGKSDRQTLMGKAPHAVLKSAGSIPVVLMSGSVEDKGLLLEAGFAGVFQ